MKKHTSNFKNDKILILIKFIALYLHTKFLYLEFARVRQKEVLFIFTTT